jgi:hypothetical protein
VHPMLGRCARKRKQSHRRNDQREEPPALGQRLRADLRSAQGEKHDRAPVSTWPHTRGYKAGEGVAHPRGSGDKGRSRADRIWEARGYKLQAVRQKARGTQKPNLPAAKARAD